MKLQAMIKDTLRWKRDCNTLQTLNDLTSANHVSFIKQLIHIAKDDITI